MGKQLNPVHAFPSLKPHFTDAIASNFFLIRIKKDVVHQVTSSVYYLLHQPFRLINIISCRSRGKTTALFNSMVIVCFICYSRPVGMLCSMLLSEQVFFSDRHTNSHQPPGTNTMLLLAFAKETDHSLHNCNNLKCEEYGRYK